MKVWELKNSPLTDVARLVYADDADITADVFDAKGEPLHWERRPRVEVFVEPRKKPKPRVDISALRPGTLVLNARAKQVIGDFLSQFGQLLELDVQGAVEWFYNVTHVIDCLDEANSQKRADGTISKEQFFANKIPQEPALFKVPRTARTRIYANDSARSLLEEMLKSAGLSGATFVEPGPPPPRPRPTQ